MMSTSLMIGLMLAYAMIAVAAEAYKHAGSARERTMALRLLAQAIHSMFGEEPSDA